MVALGRRALNVVSEIHSNVDLDFCLLLMLLEHRQIVIRALGRLLPVMMLPLVLAMIDRTVVMVHFWHLVVIGEVLSVIRVVIW